MVDPFPPKGPPMRLRPAALLASFALLTALASPPLAAAELTIPPIQYHQRTLPNGLQVLSVEDHASPNVAVQMWYHVGSKDDPQGRSGFAHLFEHLMFKSTKHMHAEQFDRLTEDVGGANNASTGDDVTNYFEVVPSNHLQTPAVGRGRAAVQPQRGRGELQVRARGGGGGIPPERAGQSRTASCSTRSIRSRTRCIRTSARPSAASRTWRRPRCRT